MAAPNPRAAGSPPFLFVAGHPALDFLNTTYGPSEARAECLTDLPALGRWLTEAGLVGAKELGGLGLSTAPSAAQDRVLREAIGLREWFASFVARRAGEPLRAPDPKSLRLLNGLLARSQTDLRLVVRPAADAGHTALALERVRQPASVEDLLNPVAEAIAQFLCEADFRQVRFCEGEGCTLSFLDTTKSHRRRWCSMAMCGNRAKAAAFRARQ